MERTLPIIFILLTFVNTSFAQNAELKLLYSCNTSASPFTKVTILDYCYNGNNIGYVQNGYSNSISPITFTGSLKDSLQRFFISPVQGTQNRELFIYLYAFFITENRDEAGEAGHFKLFMRFFTNTDNGHYTELQAIDTIYPARALSVHKVLLRIVSEHLCEIAQAVSKLEPISHSNTCTYYELVHLDSFEKLKIPIYNTPAVKKGVFYNYHQFELNIPVEKDIHIDSSPRGNFIAYTMHGSHKRRFNFDKEIYAVCDGTTTLVRMQNILCPLKKENFDFYFNVKQSSFDAGQASGTYLMFGLAGYVIGAATSKNSIYRYKINYLTGNSTLVSITDGTVTTQR